jgi:hypothetical protein
MPVTELYVDGINDVLRAFKALPKAASQELRAASMEIAGRYMAPAWREAAGYAGSWGDVLADSVKVKRDRVPAVSIGGNKKVLSGGGTATMVRYPSSSGNARQSFAPFEQTDWLRRTGGYRQAAIQEWGRAVDRIVSKWDSL